MISLGAWKTVDMQTRRRAGQGRCQARQRQRARALMTFIHSLQVTTTI